jgi:hypothetical protein
MQSIYNIFQNIPAYVIVEIVIACAFLSLAINILIIVADNREIDWKIKMKLKGLPPLPVSKKSKVDEKNKNDGRIAAKQEEKSEALETGEVIKIADEVPARNPDMIHVVGFLPTPKYVDLINMYLGDRLTLCLFSMMSIPTRSDVLMQLSFSKRNVIKENIKMAQAGTIDPDLVDFNSVDYTALGEYVRMMAVSKTVVDSEAAAKPAKKAKSLVNSSHRGPKKTSKKSRLKAKKNNSHVIIPKRNSTAHVQQSSQS